MKDTSRVRRSAVDESNEDPDVTPSPVVKGSASTHVVLVRKLRHLQTTLSQEFQI